MTLTLDTNVLLYYLVATYILGFLDVWFDHWMGNIKDFEQQTKTWIVWAWLASPIFVPLLWCARVVSWIFQLSRFILGLSS